MPEISVGITTHNLERFIVPCVEELLSQTFQNFEIIVYDDCSTDRTRPLLQSMEERHPGRIHVILGGKPLRSPARSRNALLESGMLRGKYVVFLDGDDRIEPRFLQRLYETAEKSGADMAVCAYDRFEDETGHVLCTEMVGFPSEIVFPPRTDILAFINSSLWNKLIRLDLIGQRRLPDFKVGEDLSFLLDLYKDCGRIALIDDVLIHYRVHTASVISNLQEETIYQLSEELSRLHGLTNDAWFRDSVAMVALIHVGVSMPLHAYGNKAIDERALLSRIESYFRTGFGFFCGIKWLGFIPLCRHGVKGVGIWGAKICYRLRCMRIYLALYRFVTRRLRIDIKF